MELVGGAFRVLQREAAVQVVQLLVAAQQEAAHAGVGGFPRLHTTQGTELLLATTAGRQKRSSQ